MTRSNLAPHSLESRAEQFFSELDANKFNDVTACDEINRISQSYNVGNLVACDSYKIFRKVVEKGFCDLLKAVIGFSRSGAQAPKHQVRDMMKYNKYEVFAIAFTVNNLNITNELVAVARQKNLLQDALIGALSHVVSSQNKDESEKQIVLRILETASVNHILEQVLEFNGYIAIKEAALNKNSKVFQYILLMSSRNIDANELIKLHGRDIFINALMNSDSKVFMSVARQFVAIISQIFSENNDDLYKVLSIALQNAVNRQDFDCTKDLSIVADTFHMTGMIALEFSSYKLDFQEKMAQIFKKAVLQEDFDFPRRISALVNKELLITLFKQDGFDIKLKNFKDDIQLYRMIVEYSNRTIALDESILNEKQKKFLNIYQAACVRNDEYFCDNISGAVLSQDFQTKTFLQIQKDIVIQEILSDTPLNSSKRESLIKESADRLLIYAMNQAETFRQCRLLRLQSYEVGQNKFKPYKVELFGVSEKSQSQDAVLQKIVEASNERIEAIILERFGKTPEAIGECTLEEIRTIKESRVDSDLVKECLREINNARQKIADDILEENKLSEKDFYKLFENPLPILRRGMSYDSLKSDISGEYAIADKSR